VKRLSAALLLSAADNYGRKFMKLYTHRANWPIMVRLAAGTFSHRMAFVALSWALIVLGANFCLTSHGFKLVLGLAQIFIGIWFALATRWIDRNSYWGSTK
jgi:hypothetical protein